MSGTLLKQLPEKPYIRAAPLVWNQRKAVHLRRQIGSWVAPFLENPLTQKESRPFSNLSSMRKVMIRQIIPTVPFEFKCQQVPQLFAIVIAHKGV